MTYVLIIQWPVVSHMSDDLCYKFKVKYAVSVKETVIACEQALRLWESREDTREETLHRSFACSLVARFARHKWRAY